MGQWRRLLSKIREHVSGWIVTGVIVAVTGFTPQEWTARLFRFFPAIYVGWLSWFDLRLALVALGMAIVVGSVLLQQRAGRRLAMVSGSVSPVTPAGGSSATAAGVEKPVDRANGERAAAPNAPAPTLLGRPSIAVLPFQNISGDPQQEYFCDGMAEDIITALSRFRWFFVIARNSSFSYKGRNVDVREIGRELGIRYVLEGSVRKSSDRLRITVQLVEAESGNHLWANKYDGAFVDVFDLQDQITEDVIGAVEPSVQKAEIERARRKPPENINAYDLYLQALQHAWVNTSVEAEKALQLLSEALKIDPAYAAAHGLAALCHWHRYLRGGLDPTERSEAVRHARAVLSSATDDANALAFAAFISASLDSEHEIALGAAEKAIALSPNSARAHTNRAATHMIVGNYDTAIESANYAIRLNPLDPMRYGPEGVLAISYFNLRRHGDAADAARRAIQSNPGFIHGYAVLAASYLRLGQPQEAHDTIRRALTVESKFRASSYKSAPIGPADRMESFMEDLRACGLPE